MKDLPDIDDLVSLVDDSLEDDNDLDLVKLVSTNANDENQYLLFLGSDNQFYAKNVSKIEELLVYSDLDIALNNDKQSYIIGTANIRGQMTPIVSFDQWMGNEVLDKDQYELVVIASYGGRRFALVVKEVENIVAIESNNMTGNSENNSKASFISNVTINGEDKLCTIFDSDRLILEVFDNIEKQTNVDIRNLMTSEQFTSKKQDKVILFADDSRLIRQMVEKLLLKLECQYKIYNDGLELISELPKLKPEKIGLIITDLEMPRASGREVISFIRQNTAYDNINIIVHTNMSNNAMVQGLEKNQVAKIIGKINMMDLSEAIVEFIN